jgi:dCMP deaminase
MNPKLNKTYMDVAKRFAENSYAKRLKVGCVIVTHNIMVPGYNGTPEGWDNNCEDRVWMDRGAGGWLDPEEIETRWPFEGEQLDADGVVMQGRYALKTKPEVLHAEINCISKVAKSTLSAAGSTMYVTHSPCIECAKSIFQSGITTVYYDTDYRSDDGIRFLKNSGVKVIKTGEYK